MLTVADQWRAATVTEADALAVSSDAGWVGFRLGQSLRNIWTQGAFITAGPRLSAEVVSARTAALSELGYDCSGDRKFQFVMSALRWHQREFGHLDVLQDCVLVGNQLLDAGMPPHLETFNLGTTVSDIRSGGHYNRAKWAEQLNEMSFVWDSLDHRFRTLVVPALEWHKKRFGHISVLHECVLEKQELKEAGMPSYLETYNLGFVVYNMRSHGHYGREDMVKHLNKMAFLWDSSKGRNVRVHAPKVAKSYLELIKRENASAVTHEIV